MTVLDTRDPYIQYTGTGSRVYFEYGFAWNGENVVVEVNGVPVAFEYQANGVLLAEAPPLGAEIVIWRETDITQERDFTAFDAFVGKWTEDALDKLILLKQEAAIFRAQTNLRAIHKLDRVTIDNTQGTDPDIFLWNLDQSGVFAGEVTQQMPAVGQVVPKPWDFAYFQYGAAGGGDGFVDYEIVYILDNSYSIKAIGVDYIGKTYTEFASAYVGSEQAFDIDYTNTFIFRTGGTGNIRQLVSRGNCFSVAYSEIHLGNNAPGDLLTLSGLQQFMTIGEEAFGHGMRDYNYEIGEPFDFTTAKVHTPANDSWNGLFDLRFGNNGLPEKGDALVATPLNGNAIRTYQNVGGALFSVNSFTANSLGNKTAWSCDRDSGILTSHFTAEKHFRAYQIDMSDLTISYIGQLSPTDQDVFAVAAVPDETDMFITCENTGTANDIVRTYRHDGMGGLTKLDELALVGSSPNTSAHFRVSPYSKRIWLLSQNQCNAYEVDSAGLITKLIDLPYAVGSSGTDGNFIAWVPGTDGLNITPNGFAGIKSKLYESWEMDETGSVTRVGSMGNRNLPVLLGTVTDRAGALTKAADFPGEGAPAALQITLSTDDLELRTQSTFSFTIEVEVDDLAQLGSIFARGRNDASTIDLSQFDLALQCDAANDRFRFWVRVGVTIYLADATVAGGMATGTKYMIYGEYDKQNDHVGISLDNGTLQTIALPAGSSINVYPADSRFTIGRRSSQSPQSNQQYFNGGARRFRWYWDKLTVAERDWVHNGGVGRDFSEF